MNLNRWMLSRTLVAFGGLALGLGVLLLLVKLVIALAWYASGAIALAGLILLAVGYAIGAGTGQ